MRALRIYMFGTMEIEGGHGGVSGLKSRKTQELLCYLLLHASQSLPREALASLLWAESSSTQAKAYLRKALWQLQTALKADQHAKLLQTAPAAVQLEPGPGLWADAIRFEQILAPLASQPRASIAGATARQIQDTVALYQADLLVGWYQDWCISVRARLQILYLWALERLMEYAEEQHLYETGIGHGERILAYEPASEETHRRLIRLHYLAGDRTRALRQYEQCVESLASELRAVPARATVELRDFVASAPHSTPLPTQVMQSEDTRNAEPVNLPTILIHLQQIRAELDSLQHEVELEIERGTHP